MSEQVTVPQSFHSDTFSRSDTIEDKENPRDAGCSAVGGVKLKTTPTVLVLRILEI